MSEKLFRKNLAVDVVHDGRHKLPDVALMRESIPYCVTLPDEKISFFTYTWVSKDNVAGAAMAIWGEGVGPEPIFAYLPDRPVSADMNFDDWRIENFCMRQDLKFQDATVSWETPEAAFDIKFSAFHPPYAYSSHADGCFKFAATDRIEQSGLVTGTLRIGSKTYNINTTGHRDHSWGRRDWGVMQYYRWMQCQAGDKAAVHFWEMNAFGRRMVRGYVYKDGVMAEITDLNVTWQGDERLDAKSYQCDVVDEAGRKTRVEAEVFGVYPLIPDPSFVLNESGSRVTIDGMKGAGWMEFGWPKAYLDYIEKVGVYDR